MKDAEFLLLELRASIVPQQARWPEPGMSIGNFSMRPRTKPVSVRNTFMAIHEIDHNGDLSDEGKQRQRRKAAAEALAVSSNRKRWRRRARQ